jgi:probable phosphoglycerate mutase
MGLRYRNTMTTFLLMRHGETDAIGKSVMGWRPGWRLNANGRLQAERLARRLASRPIRAIYTSPLERTCESAQIIAAAHGLTPQPDAAFGEVRFGEWEGLTLEALARIDLWHRYNRFRSGVRPPGGETMIEVQGRAVDRLASLAGAHAGETVGVVSHGDVLRGMLAYYLGIPLDLMLRFEIDPASLSILELAESGARVTLMNETGA